MKVYPSLLAANFLNLQRDIERLNQSAVDGLHYDVMDGQFVPNLSMGPFILKQIDAAFDLFLDVHLMIEHPDRYISDYANAGADRLTVHAEACIHLHRVIQQIKSHHMEVGIALNPATPINSILPVIKDIDCVLIMTVNPGFGGQSFIHSMLEKIDELNQFRAHHDLSFVIEVDGGINDETSRLCHQYGVDEVVSGSYLLASDDMTDTVKRLSND